LVVHRRLFAWGVVLGVGVVAWRVGQYVPLLGAAAIALVLGAVLRLVVPFPEVTVRTFARLGTRLLQASIVILGGSVGLVHVLLVAGGSLAIMLGTVVGGLTFIWFVGGRIGVPATVRGFLAVGTSICGASAIAAAAPALSASAAQVSYAVSAVFLTGRCFHGRPRRRADSSRSSSQAPSDRACASSLALALPDPDRCN